MHTLPDSANRLIDELARLPGIGRKTAQRLAFHFLSSDVELSHSLSNALLDIKQKIKNCLTCHGITEENPCKICGDKKRNDSLICVVENSAILPIDELYAFRYKAALLAVDFYSKSLVV